MKSFIKKSIWPLYFFSVVSLTVFGFISHQQANFIMKDHSTVEVDLKLDKTTERRRKGRTTTTYHFSYEYESKGKTYQGFYSAINDKGKKYLENPRLRIAYSNLSPDKADAYHVLESRSSFFGFIKRSIIGSLLLALVAGYFYVWASKDKKKLLPASHKNITLDNDTKKAS